MPNLSTLLKSEITRLARKEIKTAVEPLRKANAGYRKELAALKRQLAEMQKGQKQVAKAARVEAQGAETAPPRVSAKGLKSMRAKLGLSGGDFARLIGASTQSVYNWEAGKAVPRPSQRAAIAAVRGMGKRQAMAKLESLA